MSRLLSDKYTSNDTTVAQVPGTPSAKDIAGIDQLLIIVPQKAPATLWKQLPQGMKLQALARRHKSGNVPIASRRVNNQRQTALHVGKIAASEESFDLLSFARRMVQATLNEKSTVLGIWVAGFDAAASQRIARALVAAALAANFPLPSFKAGTPGVLFKQIRLLGQDARIELTRVQAEANGNNLARWLTSMPPNKLDAYEYVHVLRALAGDQGWTFRKLGIEELQKCGAGAFLAVAQGNEDDSAAMVQLKYRPKGRGKAPDLTLVGKGIIFDTGGTNLKPFNAMLDMHLDMGGSAAAVGLLKAITELKLPLAVDCWLAITENRTGPMAYKSQDVVTSASGKTIQTVHTDAEGRMALADALYFASGDKPRLIMDFATLTGACINAVTTSYSGVFTNRPDLHPVLRRCGRDCGERVWPFPIGAEFLEELASETADIKQCSPSGSGDHILAASFLNEFVDDDIAWVHMDLSACSRKGGLAHIPTTITGFGVRYTLSLLLDQQVLEHLDNG